MSYDPSAATATATATATDVAVLDSAIAAVPAAARVDLLALTRALVFTKEDYRMLRAHPAGPRQRPPVDDEAASRAIEAVLKAAVESGPAAAAAGQSPADAPAFEAPAAEVPPTVEMRIGPADVAVPAMTLAAEPADATQPADALTPWDLIEEEDGSGGVTFAQFQARRRSASRRQRAA